MTMKMSHLRTVETRQRILRLIPKSEKETLSGQSSRMTPLGWRVSASQVSRFHIMKLQKDFERTKFANDPAWPAR